MPASGSPPTRSARSRSGAKLALLEEAVFSETATEAFMDLGLLCSEAVLLASCEALGIESSLVPQIALGLGAGVGRRGHTCGAATGCALAISLALGDRIQGREARKEAVLERVGRLCRELEQHLGTLECRALTGIDLSCEEGRAQFRAEIKARVCRPIVEEAGRLLSRELREIVAGA